MDKTHHAIPYNSTIRAYNKSWFNGVAGNLDSF